MPEQLTLTYPARHEAIALRKPSRAIQVKAQWSLHQRRTANVFFWWALKHERRRGVFHIPVRLFCDLMGYSTNNYAQIRQSIADMENCRVRWGLIDDDVDLAAEADTGYVVFFPRALYSRGFITYSIESGVYEHLLEPDMFEILNLYEQKQVSTVHALSLWENCSRYRGVGGSGWIPLEVFRALMGVDHNPTYDAFKHLNNKIIKPSARQITERTSIRVTPEFWRRGRTVTHVRFKVEDNPDFKGPSLRSSKKATTGPSQPDCDRGPVYDALRNHGIDDRGASQIMRVHDDDYIKANLAWTRDAVERGGVETPSGLAIWALNNDKAGHQWATEKKQREAARTQAEADELREKANTRREAEAFLDYRIEQALAGLDDEETEKLYSAFEAWLDTRTPNPLRYIRSEAAIKAVRKTEFRAYMDEAVLPSPSQADQRRFLSNTKPTE